MCESHDTLFSPAASDPLSDHNLYYLSARRIHLRLHHQTAFTLLMTIVEF